MLYGCPKGRYLLKVLRQHIIDAGKKKVLIFVNISMTCLFLYWLLRAVYYNTVALDSSIDDAANAKIIGDFNSDKAELEILITTYRIGGQAVDLQHCCSTIVLFEPAVNTNTEIQAIGRVRRKGQKKPQSVYRFFVEGTFNTYQELTSLYKRMGEQATWGGDDVNDALKKFIPTLDGFKDKVHYLQAVRRFERYLKGNMEEGNDENVELRP